MRRMFAFVLVALFSLQTTASAASPGAMSLPSAQPLLSMIEGSWIVAVLTGQEQRYSAMHAPIPQAVRIQRDGYRPDVSHSRFAQPLVRYGAPGQDPISARTILPMRNAPLDPLAVSNRTSAPVRIPVLRAVASNYRRYVTGGNTNPASVSLLVGQSASYTLSGAVSNVGTYSGCGAIATFTATTVTGAAPGSCTEGFVGPDNRLGVPTYAETMTVTVRAPVTPTPIPTPTPTPRPTPTPTPTPIPVTPTPVPTATPPAASLPTPSTGVNSWWTYEEKALPGVGKAMVNVANGNLIVQSDDVDVPERGIDLAFRRTYNSQSTHDSAGTDGSAQSLYGNGWTSTFDAHLSYNGYVMSVYDLDGARYDFTSDGQGHWIAPPGLPGTTLTYDGDCGYFWTKKSGTSYHFRSPQGGSCTNSSAPAGKMGRLMQIYGRNTNNSIQFVYTWANGDASTAENITQIVAQHSDGQSLVLTFAKFGDNTELASITRPDGLMVTYNYDTSGNLIAVNRPGNATDDATRTATITTLSEQYWYYPGTHELQTVAGPRYVWSATNTPGSPDGGYTTFAYNTNTPSGSVQTINDYAVVNFTPQDGVNAPLQPTAQAGYDQWHTDALAYAAGATTLTDSDGHSSIWSFDGTAV